MALKYISGFGFILGLFLILSFGVQVSASQGSEGRGGLCRIIFQTIKNIFVPKLKVSKMPEGSQEIWGIRGWEKYKKNKKEGRLEY